MQHIGEFGRLLAAGGILAIMACVLYLWPGERRGNSIDDPLFTPEELRKMGIFDDED